MCLYKADLKICLYMMTKRGTSSYDGTCASSMFGLSRTSARVSAMCTSRLDQSMRFTDVGEVHMALTQAEVRESPNMEEAQVPSYELVPRFVIM